MKPPMLVNQLQRALKNPRCLLLADYERGLSMRPERHHGFFPTAWPLAQPPSRNLPSSSGGLSAQESRAIGVEWKPDAYRRCKFKSCEPSNQHAVFWRRSNAGKHPGQCLYSRARGVPGFLPLPSISPDMATPLPIHIWVWQR